MRVPRDLAALLTLTVLAACDASGEVSAADFIGRWVFTSGTAAETCQKLIGSMDAGVTTDQSQISGSETFVAMGDGGLALVDGAFGFPAGCMLAVTLDGGTAVATCRYDPSREGYGALYVGPLAFELSDDRATLTLEGSFGTGNGGAGPATSHCTSSASGILSRPP